MKRYKKGTILILATHYISASGFIKSDGDGSGFKTGTAQTTGAAPALNEASRVTGVVLAEKHRIDSANEPRKSAGASNKFLADIEWHRLEPVDLANMQPETHM